MLLKDILLNFLCFEDHLLLLNSEKRHTQCILKVVRKDCLMDIFTLSEEAAHDCGMGIS